MDIAAASIGLSMAKSQMSVGVAMAKKTMDITRTEAANLIEMIQQSAPSFGHRLDIRV